MEFHEKAHKFHAVTSIVQDYCIECLLKSLSTSSGEAVWQKKSLLGQFNNICQHHPAEADEFFTSQKPSWKRDFTFYALGMIKTVPISRASTISLCPSMCYELRVDVEALYAHVINREDVV